MAGNPRRRAALPPRRFQWRRKPCRRRHPCVDRDCSQLNLGGILSSREQFGKDLRHRQWPATARSGPRQGLRICVIARDSARVRTTPLAGSSQARVASQRRAAVGPSRRRGRHRRDGAADRRRALGATRAGLHRDSARFGDSGHGISVGSTLAAKSTLPGNAEEQPKAAATTAVGNVVPIGRALSATTPVHQGRKTSSAV